MRFSQSGSAVEKQRAVLTRHVENTVGDVQTDNVLLPSDKIFQSRKPANASWLGLFCGRWRFRRCRAFGAAARVCV